MERQRRLFAEENPLALHAIIEESALHRPVGDADVMKGQLEHLLELGARPNVDVQVIRTEVGVHSATTGSFVPPRLPDRAYGPSPPALNGL
ncbi:hypothetical protein A6A25_10800 [Saccharothrix sp. CB00851]|nr:hypothetical protein A6A25_10800 [Saccharothrix sp. CB00851]